MVVEGTFQDGSLPGRLPFVDSLVSSYVADPFWIYLERERERERDLAKNDLMLQLELGPL